MTSDRHEKWVPVQPGTFIPAGQPYRAEYERHASEYRGRSVDSMVPPSGDWFIDSSWRPPLELPTTPTWGWCAFRSVVGRNTGSRRVVGGLWVLDGPQFICTPVTVRPSSIIAWIPADGETTTRIQGAR